MYLSISTTVKGYWSCRRCAWRAGACRPKDACEQLSLESTLPSEWPIVMSLLASAIVLQAGLLTGAQQLFVGCRTEASCSCDVGCQVGVTV